MVREGPKETGPASRSFTWLGGAHPAAVDLRVPTGSAGVGLRWTNDLGDSLRVAVTKLAASRHLLVEVADSRDWETLYRNAVPRVYPALLATLRDPELAEDALHEAFAEGLRRPPATNQNLMGWLFRVALRRARRRRWAFISLRGQEQRAAADEIADLLDRMEAGRLLALLTERQRALVVAHYYLGLTQAETADLFGVRPGTVSATIAKALTRMRKGASHA